jgi:hypothetical protein
MSMSTSEPTGRELMLLGKPWHSSLPRSDRRRRSTYCGSTAGVTRSPTRIAVAPRQCRLSHPRLRRRRLCHPLLAAPSTAFVITSAKTTDPVLRRPAPSLCSRDFSLFAAPTAGGAGETTLFRFTRSDEGGASGEQLCERQRAARGACNSKRCADAAYPDHVCLAGDTGRRASHDDDTVALGNAAALGEGLVDLADHLVSVTDHRNQ